MNRFLDAADEFHKKVPIMWHNGKQIRCEALYWIMQAIAFEQERKAFEEFKKTRPDVVNLMHFRYIEQTGKE